MRIDEIIARSTRPSLYEKGTSFMWNDEHISKQLLNIHLNPELDLGSRKMSTIKKTADWILNAQKDKKELHILDLGCGPGLYTEIFAQKGHIVTGIDISGTSIDYARNSATEKKLDITYLNANYLEVNPGEDMFDLVVMIFTDLGVLVPEEIATLLDMVWRVLKKGGIFIFDVLKDNNMEDKTAPRGWEAAEKGFWKDNPYLALSESFLYKEQKVILYQHIIIDEEENTEVYRFWTHFFSQEDLSGIIRNHQFTDIHFHDDILPPGDIWNGDNVIFCKATKT